MTFSLIPIDFNEASINIELSFEERLKLHVENAKESELIDNVRVVYSFDAEACQKRPIR